MAFTPSNLSIASLGSTQLTIARVDGSITSGTNNWNSGMLDILTAWGQFRHGSTAATDTSLFCSFTGSNGTVWVTIPTSESGTSFDLLILSGFASDMTW